MSNEVVIEGELCSWQTGERSAAVMVKNPTYPSRPCSDDWAALSGRRVRVTVELAPEPESELRCPHCGGDVWDIWVSRENVKRVACSKCDAHGEGPTRQAALDALAEYLAPCPRCGGKAEYLVTINTSGKNCYAVACRQGECLIHSPYFATRAEAAQWWYKRASRS